MSLVSPHPALRECYHQEETAIQQYLINICQMSSVEIAFRLRLHSAAQNADLESCLSPALALCSLVWKSHFYYFNYVYGYVDICT